MYRPVICLKGIRASVQCSMQTLRFTCHTKIIGENNFLLRFQCLLEILKHKLTLFASLFDIYRVIGGESLLDEIDRDLHQVGVF